MKAKAKEIAIKEQHNDYERAFADFTLWLLCHSKVLRRQGGIGKLPPQAIPTNPMIVHIRDFPPGEAFQPQILGFSIWEELVLELDREAKGYITRIDINMFWEKYGIRSAQMKNRKPSTIGTMGQLIGALTKAPGVSSEEQLLGDPENAARTCVLDTKYVRGLDFDLEPADKEYLYKKGK